METLKIQIPRGFKIGKFDETTGEVSLIPLPKDIKERVKTLDDAIALLGDSDEDVIDYKAMISSCMQSHIKANQELVIITKALNEGWIPDWHNNEWDKWFNWFYNSSSSSGRFSFYFSGHRCSDSFCGSRLCFKSDDLADYAAEQFFDLYKDYYVID